MNKQSFLKELELALAGRMPAADAREVLSDYEDFFTAGVAEGETEEQVAERLGDPARIALSLLPDGAAGAKPDAAKAPTYRRVLAFATDSILAALPFLWVAPRAALVSFFFPQLIPGIALSFLGTIRISSHTWIAVARPFWINAQIASVVWFFLLNPVCLALFRGQTIGKRLFGLRVATATGSPGSAPQFFVRELLAKLALNALCGIIWEPLAFLPALASLVWSLMSPGGATVWDAIAGTRVVEATSRRREA